MERWTTPESYRDACNTLRHEGLRIGLVPTMGALHDGHIALVHEAKRTADAVIVTIFVNPTQFGPNEDLAAYPRTLEQDAARCEAAGVHGVFVPEAAAMYPPGDATRVSVTSLSQTLCGVARPHHFGGVATVVTKLLSLTGPCTAVFGRKDFQQLAIIRRLATDLFLPARIVGVPTVRETDGLALSSRNRYLSAEERRRAAAIPTALGHAVARYRAGSRTRKEIIEPVVRALSDAADRVDYVELVDPETIEPISDETLGERFLLAVAARFGQARLIDNVLLGEDPAPLAG